jgi:nicotinamide-nucleotide amidase
MKENMGSVEIISVGSEYILQHYQGSSIATIAKRLLEMGVKVDYASSIIGQENMLEEVLRQAIERSSLIIVVSGVSFGEYELTKKLVTRVLKKRLVLNYKMLDRIKAQFQSQGEEMPRSAEKQALVPAEAEILDNELGTLPGFLFTQADSCVVLLPGQTAELDAMLRTHILPRLDQKTFRQEMARTLVLKACRVSPTAIQDWMKSVERQNWHHSFNYVTDCEETTIIVTIKEDLQTDVAATLAAIEAQIRKKLGTAIYGKGSQTLEEVVGALLTERKQTLALAESCTGGLIATKLTNVPGSSKYFERGVVSYSNEAKISLLDVSPHIIETHGAVSAETAVAMAEGVRWLAQTSYGLAVTGIAGPDGGTEQKPVGLVYIALAAEQAETQWRRYQFAGDRLMVRTRTAQTALDMLRQRLLIGGGQ